MKAVFDFAEEKMQKTLDALNHEYASMRAGRATASVLDKIMVDYYGVPTPINQMAAVSVAEARILTIQPWDASTLNPIQKAIQQSDLGINPQNDGRVIRLTFPPLTEERRVLLTKDVAKYAEEAKVSVRNVRRDAIDKLEKMKKDSEITEDDLKDGKEKVQKLTDKFTKLIDESSEAKKKEIMEI